MHVSQISINNIRCYTFAQLDFSPGVNLLIGENNSGKSTILDCVLFLQAQRMPRLGLESIRRGEKMGSVLTSLANIDPSLLAPQLKQFAKRARTLFEGHDVVIETQFGAKGIASAVQARPPFTGGFNYAPFPMVQPHNFLTPYLSSRRVTELSSRVGSEYALDASGTLENLQSKIDRCQSSKVLRPKYEQACAAVLGTAVTTFPVHDGKAAGLEIDPYNPAANIRITQMGSGVTQALGLIVELLTSDNRVFVIEELETDLHPSALKSLLKLIEYSVQNGNQFLISTHSNIVLRHLGSLPDAKVFRVQATTTDNVPHSEVTEVPNDAASRRSLLAELGYDLSDYEVYDAWLLLEESSAERIIREFLVPIFTPRIVGRLRTVAADGAGDLGPRFASFNRLFAFLHLEKAFSMSAWVLADGDEAGMSSIDKLRQRFKSWPAEHFRTFTKPSFEHYYPAVFAAEAHEVLSMKDPEKRRDAKRQLLQRVLDFLREDRERAGRELAESASEIIGILREIEAAVLR